MNSMAAFGGGGFLGAQQPQQSQQNAHELQNCEERIKKAYEEAIATMHQSEANLNQCKQLEIKIAEKNRHVLEELKLLREEFSQARISAECNNYVLEDIQQNRSPVVLLQERCDELYKRPTPVIADAVLKKCWKQLDTLSKRLE